MNVGPNIYAILPADSNTINIQFHHISITDIDDDTPEWNDSDSYTLHI